MPLSEYERKMLEELEAQLAEENPGFAQSMREQGSEPSERAGSSLQFSLRHLVLGLLLALAGIAILVGGVAIEQVIIGVLGVVVLFAGMWYIVTGIKTGGEGARRTRQERPSGSNGAGSAKSAAAGFMARQMAAWEKRQNQ